MKNCVLKFLCSISSEYLLIPPETIEKHEFELKGTLQKFTTLLFNHIKLYVQIRNYEAIVFQTPTKVFLMHNIHDSQICTSEVSVALRTSEI